MTPEEIVKIIDPDNTFLGECESICRDRFGDEEFEKAMEDAS